MNRFLNKVLGASFHSTSWYTTSDWRKILGIFSELSEKMLWNIYVPLVEPWKTFCPISPELWNIFVPFVPSCGTFLSHLWKLYFKFSSYISSYYQVLIVYFKFISSCSTFISSHFYLFQVKVIHFKLVLIISLVFSLASAFMSLSGVNRRKIN